jgi:hypothetical protein
MNFALHKTKDIPQGPKGDPGPQGPPGPPTPEPARTATLIVKKHVESSEGGLAAADFTLHVSGNNALPSEFHGSEEGIIVKMAEGPYAAKEHVTTKQYNLPDGVCLSQLHFNLSGSSKDEFDGNCSDFINEINKILKC